MDSGGESKDDEELVGIANTLLVRIGRHPHIKKVGECNHRFFIDIYEGMLGESLIPRSSSKNDTIDVMTRNIQAIIDSLSEDVLGMDISHVSASSIVNKDREHIQCLLEIFDGLLQYVLEGLTREDDVDKVDCDSSDSDVLDGNHGILSDVMEEEFGRPRDCVALPLSPEGVTWRSGDNSHTVLWSDRSPGGESTATEDLLTMAQKSGNSTDELIREAQDIQRNVDLSRSLSWQGDGDSRPSPVTETLDTVLSPPLSYWSNDIPSELADDPPQPIQKVIVKEKPRKPVKDVPPPNQSRKPAEDIQPPKQARKPAGGVPPPSQSRKPADDVPPPNQSRKPAEDVPPSKQARKPADDVSPPSQSGKPAENVPPPNQSLKPSEDAPLPNQCHVLRVPVSHSGSRCPSTASSTDLKLFDLTVDSLKATESYTIPTNEVGEQSCTIPSLKESTSAKDISDLSISSLIAKPAEKLTVGAGGVRRSAAITHSSLDSGRGDSEKDPKKRKVHHSRRQRNLINNKETSGSGDTTIEDKNKTAETRKTLKKKRDKTNAQQAKEEVPLSAPSPTPKTSKHNVGNIKPKNRSKKVADKETINDPFSKGNVEGGTAVPVTDSRSKQLSDLSARLLKLQNEVRPHMALPRQSNITIDTTTTNKQSNITTSTQDPHPAVSNQGNQAAQVDDEGSGECDVPRKEKKDKGKVSFQLDNRYEYEYPASDTEIDYSIYSSFRDSGRDSHAEETQNVENSIEDSLAQTEDLNEKKSLTQSNQDSTILTSKAITQDATTTSMNDTTLDATPPLEKQYLKRDERLQKLHKRLKVEEKENRRSVQKLSDNYSKHHGKLINQKRQVQKQSNLQLKTQKQKEKEVKKFKPTPSPARGRNAGLKTTANNKYAAKLSAIYGKGSPSKKGSPEKKSHARAEKRAASTSPVARRRLTKAPLVLEENEILPLMEEEFPFIHLSPHTAKMMWQKQLRQVSNLRKYGQPHKSLKSKRTMEDAVKKQEALSSMMKKEIEHNRRLKELKERKDQDTVVKRKLHERRQRSARARRYYNEFAVLNKARMLKKRTKEEKIFKQLFEDGLDIQKQRINEMRKYAREKKEMNEKKQRDEIASLENFYKDKFACLAESVAQEKYDLEVRRKAQGQVLNKMRSTMRKRMEKDLRDIQDELNNEDDPCFFRQLDADVLKKEFQLATYKASKLR